MISQAMSEEKEIGSDDCYYQFANTSYKWCKYLIIISFEQMLNSGVIKLEHVKYCDYYHFTM